MSLDDMPSEICLDIFSRLPTKTLIRCTTLSPKYQSLITSPAFTHAHIHRNTTNNNKSHQFFLRFSYDRKKKDTLVFEPQLDDQPLSGFASLSLLDKEYVFAKSYESGGLEVPIKSHCEMFNIVGSINGIICLSDDYMSYTNVYVLWNPSIRKWLKLPRPLITFQTHGPHDQGCGFGFDPLTNDYKVVRIVRLEFQEPPLIEVYSLNSGCWRMVGVGPVCDNDIVHCSPLHVVRTPCCCINGIVHWVGVAYGIGWSDKYHAILTFNVSSEVCGIMDLPECLKLDDCSGEGLNSVKRDVFEYMGMLAVVRLDSKPPTCCIWAMKEYGVVDSWTKMFHIKFPAYIGVRWRIDFGSNGEIIMPLLWYDDGDRAVDKVALLDTTGKIQRVFGQVAGGGYHVARYVESLALFDAEKRAEEPSD